MQNWIVEVEADQMQDGEVYFLAIRPATKMTLYLFAAEGLDGKFRWSQKPGIANRYVGREEIREHLRKNQNHVAVLVPADADKRWKARRERRKR